jgi:tryptophan synthase alpha chain
MTATTTGLDRVEAVFARVRAEGRAALIGYLPAGYPTVAGSLEAFRTLVEHGVDLVEVGLPYSDPLMDGPVIQAAVEGALRGGVRTPDVLATVEALAADDVPAVVMSYWNPVERYGVDRFATDLAAAGGAGVITPDLIPDEAGAWLPAARQAALATVFLVAPSSTDPRIAATADACRGFVYAASTMGVTGERSGVGAAAFDLVSRVRTASDLPVGVGLGVSSGAQAAAVAEVADGVIVGSALVRRLLEGEDLAPLVRELAAGVRGGPGS